jgi:hypothetical protein
MNIGPSIGQDEKSVIGFVQNIQNIESDVKHVVSLFLAPLLCQMSGTARLIAESASLQRFARVRSPDRDQWFESN